MGRGRGRKGTSTASAARARRGGEDGGGEEGLPEGRRRRHAREGEGEVCGRAMEWIRLGRGRREKERKIKFPLIPAGDQEIRFAKGT